MQKRSTKLTRTLSTHDLERVTGGVEPGPGGGLLAGATAGAAQGTVIPQPYPPLNWGAPNNPWPTPPPTL